MAKFKFDGKDYTYFTHEYNDTRHNERAVEIALAGELIDKYAGSNILEIGNVLSNYAKFPHDIVDKYDEGEGVQNIDIVYYQPKEKYDLILSLSTFEHVGWDGKEERNTGKIMKALEHVKTMLKPAGLLFVTMPLGYNDELDKMIYNQELQFDKIIFMHRDDYNGWEEKTFDEVTKLDNTREVGYIGTYHDSLKGNIGMVTKYVTCLFTGQYFGRPEKKEYKAIFSASLNSEAGNG
jgi:SAM-dependent methyltransferase